MRLSRRILATVLLTGIWTGLFGKYLMWILFRSQISHREGATLKPEAALCTSRLVFGAPRGGAVVHSFSIDHRTRVAGVGSSTLVASSSPGKPVVSPGIQSHIWAD